MKRSSKAAILFVATFLAYSPALFFSDFVYDDVVLLLKNQAAHAVSSWDELFHFFIQPTRPLANWILAGVHWWGKGHIVWQRAVSLSLHAATVSVAYLYLEKLFRKTAEGVPTRVAFWSALFFALHPIVSEVNAVASFRWEILGTFFLFLSGLCALEGAYLSLFFTMGLSFLCKENFIVLTPLLVLATLRLLDPQFDRRHILRVFKLALPWLVTVLLLTRIPTSFPYREYVGLGIDPSRFDWILSVNALYESARQILWGGGLSLLRLTDKPLPIPALPTWAIVVFLATPLIVLLPLAIRKTASALCLSVGLVNLYFYLLLPNINIGSARYYYPALPFIAAVALVWASRFYVHQKIQWALAAYAIFLGIKTEIRLQEFRSQRSLAEAENSKHPDVEFTWLALVHLYERLPTPERLTEKVSHRLEEAASHFPKNLYLRLQQMRLRYERGDQDGARRVVSDLERAGLGPAEENEFRFETLMASVNAGDCEFAQKNFSQLTQRCQLRKPPESAPTPRCGLDISAQMFLDCRG